MRRECLNHLVLMNERTLWDVLENYTEHFHHERPHQGFENKIIAPQFRALETTTSVPILLPQHQLVTT